MPPKVTIEDVLIEMRAGFKQVNNDMSEVKQRLTVVEQDIKAMKNTPTMKKELGIK